MRSWVFACSLGAVLPGLAQDTSAVDTAAAITRIEQRMTDVDHFSIGAVYLVFADQDRAERLLPDSAVLGNPSERDELYTDANGRVAGVGTFIRSTYPNVVESSCHYFDEDGNTVAVWWRMKWTLSGCTDSVAIETRYLYFSAPTEELLQYATLTDNHGHDLNAPACKFPDIERHFDAYYHRDMLLLSKHIDLE